LEMHDLLRFKWILILEAMFAGAYISLTQGLFVIYLTSIGQEVEEISFVVPCLSSRIIAYWHFHLQKLLLYYEKGKT